MGAGQEGRGAEGWGSAVEAAEEDLEGSMTSQHPGVPRPPKNPQEHRPSTNTVAEGNPADGEEHG